MEVKRFSRLPCEGPPFKRSISIFCSTIDMGERDILRLGEDFIIEWMFACDDDGTTDGLRINAPPIPQSPMPIDDAMVTLYNARGEQLRLPRIWLTEADNHDEGTIVFIPFVVYVSGIPLRVGCKRMRITNLPG